MVVDILASKRLFNGTILLVLSYTVLPLQKALSITNLLITNLRQIFSAVTAENILQ